MLVKRDGRNCGCVKCLTARWKAAWEAVLIAHEPRSFERTPVPADFELRCFLTEGRPVTPYCQWGGDWLVYK